jgi:single-stranded-DNA-specific exonuclease
MSKWLVYTKKADFNAIQEKYGIDKVIARIMRNRDVCTDEEIKRYLTGDYNDLHSPYLLKDAKKAVDIIIRKINENKKIRIIGDYDIDGVCSITILYKALLKAGARVDYVVPHRINDGYGINEHLIDDAIAEGTDTIITCDNGIAAIPQIAYAKQNGLTVIVTDHHDIPFVDKNGVKQLLSSEADAIVDPKQADCTYPFDKICGAVVAFKVVEILYDSLHLDKADLKEYMELMAVATVGDVVDLQDENRIIVKKGLKSIAATSNVGLRALVESCQLNISQLSAYHIGFVIGPCLNASGRLDTAQRAISLLLCEDNNEASIMAEELCALNDERKQITDVQAKKAIELVAGTDLMNDNVLVVYLPECHESVAGIIAGRIRERFYKPTIVITDASDGAKGSGRSIEGYNMFEEISKCGELLTKYGGHPMAAGLSLEKDNIDSFRRALNEKQTLTEKELTCVTWIDVPMPVSYVTFKLVEQLAVLEPFGKANEKPVFADKNLLVKSAYMIGKNKNVLKMKLESSDGTVADAVQFKVEEEEMPLAGQKISIVYYPDINEYNGKRSIQFVVKEWCYTK